MNGYDRGNYVYIFDLKKLPSMNNSVKYEFEYNVHKNDIVTRVK